MHKQLIKKMVSVRNIFTSFFLAIFLSIMFFVVCVPFLVDAGNLSYSEKASIGGINLWRIVIIYGLLTVIATVVSIRQKKR